MNKHTIRPTSNPAARPRILGLAIACALAGGFVAPAAQAFDFEFGDGWRGTLDTTVSYGISMRTQDAATDLTGKASINPLLNFAPSTRPPYTLAELNQIQRAAPGRFSVNSDWGTLNYPKSGDVFSNAFRVTSELSINRNDEWGAFLRASYFYDFENENARFLSRVARKEQVGSRFRVLDAFVFSNFTLGDLPASVRLGQQVVNWGESTFITNGIGVINPADVARLRSAGSELREALLPVNMIYGTLNLSQDFSIEALYLLEFEQIEADPAGSYFSTNNFATNDGTFLMLGFGTTPAPVRNPDLFWDVCYRGGQSDVPIINANPTLRATACGSAVPRNPDVFPSSSGQFGVAARYLASWLGDTELGFYFLNYHSRLPLLSGISVTSSNANSGRYFVEYPEDIRLYGVSFNTTIGVETSIALQGEISYRDNVPLQVDDVELLFSALSPLNALIPQPVNRFISQLGSVPPGTVVRGWDRHEVTQWQVTATKLFVDVLGAQQVALVAEVGGTKVWDLPDPSSLRYQGDGTDTSGGPDFQTGAFRNPVTQTTGFPTPYSWGYRTVVRADYNSVFGTALNLSPRIAFNHDVNGITPGPGGNFIEGRKSLTLGVEGTYLQKFTGDLSYTRFMGAGNLNLIHDRDFVAFTVRYSF